MNYADAELRERLAAEYALGTLRGPARRRFERLMREDQSLRHLVARWEGRINPLAEWVRPVAPPPRVWDAVARGIGGAQEAGAGERGSLLSRLWNSLDLWRGVGMTAAAATIALIVYVAALHQPAAPSHIAVLSDRNGQPAWIASIDEDSGALRLRPIAVPPTEPGKSLELWLLPPVGDPRSLGLIKATGYAAKMTYGQATALASGGLAVSLEPQGGSPTGRPTGPVLWSGRVVPNI